MNQRQKNPKKKQYIVHYAGLGLYSEVKDVNEEKEARIRAAKSKATNSYGQKSS